MLFSFSFIYLHLSISRSRMTTSFSVSTESADSRGITLISSDGNTFSISPYGIRLSSYVKSFVEENPEEQELNVPVVDGAQLKKIVEFVQHHENEPMKTLPKVCLVSCLRL